MATVHVSFGSNLGDRASHIRNAIDLTSDFIRWQFITPLVETAPYGKIDQPAFLNAVGKGETGLTPEELLRALLDVEKKLGRTREVRWGPRIIDLDILTYDNLVLHSEVLTVPHPDLHNRDFLLKLLCQFFPEWYHPVLKKNACELLDDLTARMPTSFKNDNLRRVLAALGNPHDKVRTVYVTGSSGKGSVAAMVAALFNDNVGLFLSPFVCTSAEMVMIDGKKADLSSFKQQVLSVAKDLNVELTPFELLTGAAYLAFAKAKKEWAVVETGIESQQDATNVKKHDISVVTALGMDHFDLFPDYEFYLRELLDSLSGSVISLEPLPGVDADVVVQAKYSIEDPQINLDGTQAYVTGMGRIQTRMLGLHQIWNALLAGEVYRSATGKEPEFSLLSDVVLPARIQVVRKDPLLIVDGGHNAPAFKSLVATINDLGVNPMRIILGLVKGKDYEVALSYLKRLGSQIFYYPPFSDRALAELPGIPTLPNIYEALEEPTPTLVAGSFYLAGPVLRYFNACQLG